MSRLIGALVLLGLVALCYCDVKSSKIPSFEQWKARYGKVYTSFAEESERKKNFYSNVHKIITHNQDSSSSYKMAINKFADLSRSEIRNMLLGEPVNFASSASTESTPSDDIVNWCASGYCPPVEDQESEGSDPVLIATWENLISTLAIAGMEEEISEQQIIDCPTDYSISGIYQYIINAGGIDQASCYPYTGEQGTCRFQKDCVAYTLSSYTNITDGNDGLLKQALGVGTVAAYVDASNWVFYESGIFDGPCSSTALDHAVLVVGYGVDSSNDPYWIAQNSWGAEWGMNGFIWISSSTPNMCGISQASAQPTWDTTQ